MENEAWKSKYSFFQFCRFVPPAPPDLPVVSSISLPPQLHPPKSRISINSKDIYS